MAAARRTFDEDLSQHLTAVENGTPINLTALLPAAQLYDDFNKLFIVACLASPNELATLLHHNLTKTKAAIFVQMQNIGGDYHYAEFRRFYEDDNLNMFTLLNLAIQSNVPKNGLNALIGLWKCCNHNPQFVMNEWVAAATLAVRTGNKDALELLFLYLKQRSNEDHEIGYALTQNQAIALLKIAIETKQEGLVTLILDEIKIPKSVLNAIIPQTKPSQALCQHLINRYQARRLQQDVSRLEAFRDKHFLGEKKVAEIRTQPGYDPSLFSSQAEKAKSAPQLGDSKVTTKEEKHTNETRYCC